MQQVLKIKTSLYQAQVENGKVLWLEGLVDNMSYICRYDIQNVDVGDEMLFVKEKCIQARDPLDHTFIKLNLVCIYHDRAALLLSWLR